MTEAREIELTRHITVLRSALEDAPHSTVLDDSSSAVAYTDWYQRVRGPALESTDPDRWKPISRT
jgi:hypothetical protein